MRPTNAPQIDNPCMFKYIDARSANERTMALCFFPALTPVCDIPDTFPPSFVPSPSSVWIHEAAQIIMETMSHMAVGARGSA